MGTAHGVISYIGIYPKERLPGIKTHAVIEVQGNVQLACNPSKKVSKGMVGKRYIDEVDCQACREVPYNMQKYIETIGV